MNNKKLLAFFIILIAVVAVVILGLQRCEPREKEEQPSTEDFEEPATEKSAEEYYNAFINANIAFTCQLKKDSSLLEDDALFKEKLNKAYADNGLPVNNDPLMIEILNLYEDDQEVIRIVKENTVECP